MAQQVLVAKVLSLIPRIHIGEGENQFPKFILSPLHVHWDMHMCIYARTHTVHTYICVLRTTIF